MQRRGLTALGAVRSTHLGAAAPKEAVIGGARYELAIYRSPDGKNIRTFYPSFAAPRRTSMGPRGTTTRLSTIRPSRR